MAPGPAVTAAKWSELPVEARSAQLARKVRAIAVEQIKASWEKFKEELEVQKLVWQSLARLQRDDAQDLGQLQAGLEAAWGAYRSGLGGDTGRALLEKALPASEGVLSKSMRDAVCNVLKQEKARAPRTALAEKLEVASSPAILACPEKELEELVVASHLAEATLEKRVRLLFRLSLPPELLKKKASALGAPLSKHSQSALVGHAVTGKKNSSSMGAPLAERSASALPQPLSNPLTGKKSSSELPSTMKATKVAERVRGLLPGSWKRFQEEYDVQKLVWESQALTKGKEFLKEISSVRSRFDLALASLSGDVGDHLPVEQALRAGQAGSGLLSKAMLEAASDVVKSAACAAPRGRLADRLAAAENITPGLPVHSPAEAKDLESLIAACSIEDPKLMVNVRRACRLPVESVSTAPRGATTRSASTGGVGVKSKTAQEMRFQPQARGNIYMQL
jgi:hypothetical protein